MRKLASTYLRGTVLVIVVVLTGISASNASPVKVEGQIKSPSSILRKYMPQGASPVLLCLSRSLNGPASEWVPKTEQILGVFTNGFYQPEIKFEFNLPISPVCRSVDLDNNGKADTGVMVFAAVAAIELFGDAYLEQVEQENGIGSYSFDSKARTIRQGTFVIFSPDEKQRISSGFGADKRLFTSDDPTVSLPQGYSLMRISGDGKIDFDRSTVLRLDITTAEEAKNPDFSDQSILRSFNSLIDLLKERYAYTELRKIDWEKQRAKYLDRIKEADRNNDLADYYIVLYEFAARLRDGHVQVGSSDIKISRRRIEKLGKEFAGNLGIKIIRYSDGRFMAFSVAKDSSADRSGIVVGSEILRINGLDVQSHLDLIQPMGFFGTKGRATESALRFAGLFPLGTSVAVEFRVPGDTRPKSANIEATVVQEEAFKGFPRNSNPDMPFEMRSLADGRFGYVRWTDFSNIPYFVSGFETFLSRWYGQPGIVIDMRGNSGGLMGLYFTMASYMFAPEKPANKDWLDYYVYDDLNRSFAKEPDEGGKKISSPIPELAFNGEVVVLVDGESASSGEFFPQFLQKSGRATIISDASTNGAGGSVRLAILPGKISFTYTGGQMFYAGTKDVNLEGKGVVPDIHVPIDDDYVRRRMAGEDVVLSRAIEYLESKAAKK